MARDFRSERNSLVPHGSMVQQRFASFACNLENSTALETQVGTFQLYKQAREREKESEREKCIGISRWLIILLPCITIAERRLVLHRSREQTRESDKVHGRLYLVLHGYWPLKPNYHLPFIYLLNFFFFNLWSLNYF